MDVTENVPPNIRILKIEYEYRFAEYEKEKIPPRFPVYTLSPGIDSVIGRR